MENGRKLKYGTALVVLTSILGGLYILAAILVFSARDMIIQMLGGTGAITTEFESILTGVAIILIVIAVFLILGGIKARFSRGWTIFLIVIGSLITLSGLTEFELFTLIAGAAILTLSIFNLQDANLRTQEEIAAYKTTQNVQKEQELSNSLEKRLLELEDLKTRGVINNEEYESLRKDAINKL